MMGNEIETRKTYFWLPNNHDQGDLPNPMDGTASGKKDATYEQNLTLTVLQQMLQDKLWER
jgi:hypothetical protein